jgi:hypothetical protein
MADYEIGYRRPPQSKRFRAGASGNPKGRPKRKASTLAETINKVLNAPIEYQERGKTKVASARELSLRMLVSRAVSGNLEAVELLRKILEHVARYGDTGREEIAITDWLPDYPGQSGEQKTQDLKEGREHDAQSAQQSERAKK